MNCAHVSANTSALSVAIPHRAYVSISIRRALLILTGSVAICIAPLNSRALAQNITSRTAYGELGLLDMPNSRMAPDGEISFTFADIQGSQRFNFGFQLLPWLEGSFRYSRLPRVRGQVALYDRSFGMKIRLSRETENLPEVSLGIRDILGTGVYSAEYLVATKSIGPLDITAGVGWGRLGSVGAFKNPFSWVFPSFGTRPTFTGGTGGTVNFGEFFHGAKVGIFGGAVWHSPIENLDLMLEYSSDKYIEETAGGSFKYRLPINVGLSYHLSNVGTVSAGWFYGATYGLILNMSVDPTVSASPRKFGPEIVQPVIRPAKQQIDALAQLVAMNRKIDTTLPVRPFVELPPPRQEMNSLALTSALMSVGMGVHDVEISGRAVIIDAMLTKSASLQCNQYAQIVSALAPHLETIALSELDNSSGNVAICKISHAGILPVIDDTAPVSNAEGAEHLPIDPDPSAADRKIRDDVAAQSIGIEALSIEPEMVWIYFSNRRYASEAAAAGRIARVLMADAPSNIEIFHIISVRNGIQLRDFQVSRSALERSTLAYGTTAEMGEAVSIRAANLSNPVLEREWDATYPRIHWSIGPGLREGLFDPKRPLQVQILAAAEASIEFTPNIVVEGRVEANIFNTYDLGQIADSLLPHVRSDSTQYFRHGLNGISNLDALYRTRISPDIYFEVKAGYLEDMFAGGGVQVLWRPDAGRVALGFDLYQVWQRNFDRLFGLQNYKILTGHASLYYESPWYGLDFAVHAGRYLAGDYGATIEVTRRFSTGVEVGAFATFTNVPFAKFGEGSFDKGIIIHIPLEWALPFYTQSSYDLLLRSLSRDGGQRLEDDDSLYQDTRPNSYGEIFDHVDEIIAP